MPLGKSSKLRLSTCHSEIRRFIEAVSDGVERGECPGVEEITVLCGYRGEKEQNDAFERGTSKLRWPHSKHNRLPSQAVDIAPYPVDWKDTKRFESLRVYALEVAARIGVSIRVISWDLPHYEMSANPSDAVKPKPEGVPNVNTGGTHGSVATNVASTGKPRSG